MFKKLFCRHTYISRGYGTSIDICSCGCGAVYERNYEAYQCEKCGKFKKREVYRASAVKERLAEYAHKQWSGWMEYLFSKCVLKADGTAIIPAWAVDRWKRQIDTAYDNLSEQEKESDRKEAEGMLEIIRRDK